MVVIILPVQALLAHIKNDGKVTVCLPFGKCYLSRLDAQKPILFIAAELGLPPLNR